MGVLRTGLALGVLAMSLPMGAQNSRYGWDRGRADRDRDARGGTRTEVRTDNRNGNRAAPRNENRLGSIPDFRGERRERRESPRVEVRPPVIEHRDGRDYRFDGRERIDRRYVPVPRRVRYGWNDRDFRQRDMLAITAWFRNIGPARMSVYGFHDRGWYGERYDLRPGFYLSMSLLARLDAVPFDLEFELGDLPWYLERRIYGRTVLVIDMRTRLVVDMYDIDW